MKKRLLFFALIIAFLLPSCSDIMKNQTGMIIQPTRFSNETQKTLKIFDAETLFLDYTIDDTAKYYSINLWIYEDGKWVSGGSVSNSERQLDMNNRLAIHLKDIGVDIFTFDKTGDYIKYGLNGGGMELKNSISIASQRITKPTQISLNEEIPMWVIWGTNKNSMEVIDANDFRNLECTEGVAITITFSDKKIKQ
ncbi:hypothetical protein [Anaerotignum sp.]|uniref:hypothetical protein n=1 Tax=Anaerotignum sp. TaxID=2039241 RepID=UPI00289F27C3|nr:hypothetical protein [Anaerotignum sp.]